MSQEEKNVQLVKDTYAALWRGDIPACLDMLTDDVTVVVPGPADVPFAGTFHGKQAFVDWLALFQELNSQPVDIQTYIAQGDTVVVLVHEEPVLRRTGRRCIDDEAHVFTVRDGKIVRWQEYYDTAVYADAYRDK